MNHLAEVHIIDGLQSYAEDVYMRALVMQSNLESAACAVSHMKSIAQAKVILPTDADEADEEEAQDFLKRADVLISQIRSTKVISGKAVHQLEELQSRSLTLDPSTVTAIEQYEAATSDLAAACRDSGVSVCAFVNEEGRTSSFTYNEVTKTISNSDSTPFSSLSSKLHNATTQIQAFFNLTTTLSQTIEFPPPSTLPPWELLSQKLKEETTTSATHEKEIGRLKDELSEKKTALAMKDKILEEMSVNVEVLSKRVNEVGGRREKLRELETLVETSRNKEQVAAKKLMEAESALHAAETERDTWKTQASQMLKTGVEKVPGLPTDFVSVKSTADIAVLKQEVETLQATIRHLRLNNQVAAFSAGYSFLASPLTPPPSPPSQQDILAHEAKDVLNSMLKLITRPEAQVVELKERSKDQRLAWRPARESARYNVDRQKEEWGAWKGWRDDVAKRSKEVERKALRKEKRVSKATELGFAVPGAFRPWNLEKADQETEVKVLSWDRVGDGM